MTREDQFVMLAQSAFLAAAVREPESIHPGCMLSHMSEAFRAAKMVPGDTDVSEAARDFCSWMLDEYERPHWV